MKDKYLFIRTEHHSFFIELFDEMSIEYLLFQIMKECMDGLHEEVYSISITNTLPSN